MILAFTGTRRGVSPAQREALPSVLATLPERVLHGGAEGADTQFNDFIRHAGMFDENIDVYPTRETIEFWRSYQPRSVIHEPVQPLVRNRLMAHRCDRLLGCPASADEQLRSGTWATVRYARAARKPITIIAPDGLVWEERP